ncbi:pentapeptide repeat-containing protein, partial [bacterium]|nr:pentapeptide repeat-containing protein [bacterium]
MNISPPNILRLSNTRLLFLISGFVFSLPQLHAEVLRYHFSGIITKIPVGGGPPDRSDNPFSPAFDDFLEKDASLVIIVDTNAPDNNADSFTGQYDILSAKFTFHTFGGTLDPENTQLWIIDGSAEHPWSNSDYFSFGLGTGGSIRSFYGLPPLPANPERPDEPNLYFTQFSLTDFSGDSIQSDAQPGIFDLNDYPDLRLLSVSVQAPSTSFPNPARIYGDQLRADFSSLSISVIPESPSALDPNGTGSVNGYSIGPNVDLYGAFLRGTNLSGANLAEANLAAANLDGSSLTNANLSSADLSDADLEGVDFSGSNLEGADLSGSDITGVSSGEITGTPSALPQGFQLINGYLVGPKANLAGAILSNADLSSADLSSISSGGITGQPSALPQGFKLISGYLVGPTANLSGANLSGANLSEVDLTRANLSGANLSGAALDRANLTDTNLSGISSGAITGNPSALPWGFQLISGYLIGYNVNLRGANLSGVDLSGIELDGSDFSNADLSGADFSSNFIGSIDVSGANLSDANFSNSFIWGGDFSGANLSNTNLAGANLENVSSGGIIGRPAELPQDFQIANGYLVGPNVDLSDADLSGSDLTGVSSGGITGTPTALPQGFQFINGYLVGPGAILTNANLSSADLSNVDLSGTNLTGANLDNVSSGGIIGSPNALPPGFKIIKGYLVGNNVDLSNANLTGADLSSVQLTNSNLSKADLSRANCSEIDLSASNLTGVLSGGITGTPSALPQGFKLISGYLVGPKTNLSEADLTSADLSNVNLSGAELTDVDLSGADLNGVSSGGIIGVPSSLPQGFLVVSGYLVGPNANLNGANLNGADLSGADLTNAELSGVSSGGIIGVPSVLPQKFKLINGYLVGPDTGLREANLANSDLSNTDLSRAGLFYADLSNTDLSNTNFTGADLNGVSSGGITGNPAALPQGFQVVKGYLVGPSAELSDADLANANLSGVDLTRANLSGANLDNVLSGGLIGNAATLPQNFQIANGYLVGPKANLSGADLTGLNLSDADLSGANLSEIDFSRTQLNGADLSRADLSGADFSSGWNNLTGANLAGVNLAGANLSTNLKDVRSGGIVGVPSALPAEFHLINGYLVGPGVDLTDSDFSNANLSGVDLTGADLTGADLTGADLTDADFTGANLSGVVTNDRDFFRQIDQYNFSRGNISLTRRTSTFSIETLSLSRQPVSITEYDKEFDTRPDWSEWEEWELEEFGINPNDDPRELAVARATVTERSIHFGVNLSKTSLSRGSSSGNLSLNFRVNQETSYNVAGFTKFLEVAGSSSMNASLSGDSIEAIFSVSHKSEGSPLVSLDDEVREGRGNHLQGKLSGILQPGEYQLNVGIVHNGGWESVGSGEFTMTFGSSKDGKVVSWGQGGDFSSVASELDRGVKTVAATRNAFAALKNNGSVVTWGNDSNGGDSSQVISKLLGGVDAIYANNEAFAALKEDGSVVTWGNAECGGNSSVYRATGPSWDIHSVHEEISVASKLSSGVVQIFANHCAFAALKEDGSVVTWGNGLRGGGSSSVESELTDIVKIYPSEICFAAVKQDGSVVTWGDPASGGDSSPVRSALSSDVEAIYSNGLSFAALKTDGSVITWGDSVFGGDSSSVASELQSGVATIHSTQRAFAALKVDGSVVTWGGPDQFGNDYGGDSSAVKSDLLSGVEDIIPASNGAFAAIKSDGSVVTWGRGSIGDDANSIAFFLSSGVRSITSTSDCFSALKEDGSVMTWGMLDSRRTNRTVEDSKRVADELAGGVKAIYSNQSSFAALKTDGSLVTWGFSSSFGADSSSVSQELASGVVEVFASKIGWGFAALKRELTDTDDDSLTDEEEIYFTNTNPMSADTDRNGVLDGEDDQDGDGLTNLAELNIYNTNPLSSDTDNDGLNDGLEVANAIDSDDDGYADWLEQSEGTDPNDNTSIPTRSIALFEIENGSVAGADTYALGAEAVLTATPSLGYIFANWNGDSTATDNPLTIVMDSDQSIGTTFGPDTRDSDEDGLSNYQEIIVLGTDPNNEDSDGDGYGDGLEQDEGTDPKDNASIPTRSIILLDLENGSVAGADTYALGAEAVLTATPSAGYVFVSWNGDSTATVNPLTITMDSGQSIGTTFGPDTRDSDEDGLSNYQEIIVLGTDPNNGDSDGDGYGDGLEQDEGTDPNEAESYPQRTLTVPTVENGSVSGSGSYALGITATLTATPAAGYVFISWNSAIKNPLTITMDTNQSISAIFGPDTRDPDADGLNNYQELVLFKTDPADSDSDDDGYPDGQEQDEGTDPNQAESYPQRTLTLLDIENGSVVGADTYALGAEAALIATPSPGYVFASWNGDSIATDNRLTITMDSDQSVGATFSQDTRDPDEDGLSNYQELVLFNTDPTDSDSDDDGYEDGQEQGEGTDPNQAESYPQRALTVPTVENGSVSGGGSYALGVTATLTATPAIGYVFTSWSGGSTATDNPLTITMDDEQSVGAIFSQDTRDSDEDGLSNYQELVLFKTDPADSDSDDDGYLDGQEQTEGTDPNEAESFPTRVLTINDSANGTFTGGGVYQLGVTATLQAIPDKGYLFGGWVGEVIGESNPLSITMLVNQSVGANFEQDSRDSDEDGLSNYQELVVFNTDPTDSDSDDDGYLDGQEQTEGTDPNESGSYPTRSLATERVNNGSISGSGTYALGEEVVVTANPDPGFIFAWWSGNASGSVNPLAVIMTSNLSIGAAFVPDNRDNDGDGLSNFSELKIHNTDPNKFDSDGDGFSDGLEISERTNPNVSSLFPTRTIGISDSANGFVEGGGTYPLGVTIEVTATPSAGYLFFKWVGDVDGTENPLSLKISSNLNLEAIFQQDERDSDLDGLS